MKISKNILNHLSERNLFLFFYSFSLINFFYSKPIIPFFSILSMFFAFILFPGLFILKIFKTEVFDISDDLPVSFLFGFSVFALISYIALLMNLSFKIFYIIIILYSGLILILFYVNKFKFSPYLKIHDIPSPLISILIFTGLISWLLISIFKGPITMDSLTTCSYIGKLFSGDSVKIIDGFYENNPYDILKYNPWVVFIGTISRISCVEYISVYSLMPIILMPFTVFSVFFFSKKISSNIRLAAITTILFLFFNLFNEGLWIWRTNSYTMVLTNFIFIPIFIGLIFNEKNQSGKYRFLIFGISFFCIATMHLVAFVNLSIILLSYFTLSMVFDQNEIKGNRQRAIPLILFCIIFSMIYLVKIIPEVSLSNPYHMKISGILYLTKNSFIVDPLRLFVPHYHVKPCFSLRIFLCPCAGIVIFLIPFIKTRPFARYSVIITFTSVLLMINPIIIPIFNDVVGYASINKINQIIPFEFIFASVIILYSEIFFNEIKKRIYFEIIIIALTGLSLLIGGIFVNKRLLNFFKSERSTSSNIWKADFIENGCLPQYMKNTEIYIPVLKYIKSNIHEQSVIFADPELSLFITAFTKHFVFAVVPEQSPTGASDQLKRMEIQNMFLSNNYSTSQFENIFNDYKIKYIILSKKKTADFFPKSLIRNSDLSLIELYPIIWQNDQFVIFKRNLSK